MTVTDPVSTLAPLRGFEDEDVLAELAGHFVQHECAPGDALVEFGHRADQVFLVAHGKISKIGTGAYGDQTVLGTLADGGYFGEGALTADDGIWEFTAKAITACTVLSLPRNEFRGVLDQSETLRAHLETAAADEAGTANDHGEAVIDVASGHDGEPWLPGTFVDYDSSPREYELSVAQTVLRVHSRVADLYNQPMNQIEQQLRLTVEALRERQEHELVNNTDFGLLHNADFSQRIRTRTGPPTPDDLDDLPALVWKEGQTGLPDEYQPGLNVRFMGISGRAIMSYLVSAYYSAAVLVPDALAVLENAEIGRGD